MKKLLKKISIIVAITVLATTISAGFGVTASATGSLLTPGQEGLLRTLGIVTEKTPNYDKALTRGELAHIAARLSNAPAYNGSEYYFYDVAQESAYFADIYALAQMGILSGDGNGYFRPNDQVTDIEICKVFSVILGYKDAGEYMSYLRIARDAEITDGISMDGVVTYGEALAMAFNTLHGDMFEAISYGETKKYKKNEGYLAIECYHNLVKQDGIVKGIPYTNLIEPTDMIPEGSIQINNRIFTWDDESLLGKYTVFYSEREGSSTSKEIFYIYADETRNNIVTLDGEDVIGVRDGELKYWVGGKDKGYKLTLAPDVIVNGVAHPGFTDADLQPPAGTITLIDNDDDNAYDVITVDHVEYMVYGSQDKENTILYGKYPEITIGGKNQTNDIVMTGPYGKVNLGTLSEGTVLKLRRSKNTTGTIKARMTQLSDVVTGQITSIANDKITVNGMEYIVNNSTVIDEQILIGETVSVYPDGDLAAVVLHASNDAYQFAYLVGATNIGQGFKEELAFRIIDGNYILQEFTATDPIFIDEIKYTDVEAAMTRLETAHNMRSYNEEEVSAILPIDGTTTVTHQDRMEEGDAKFPYSQAIRFKLNDEGKLTHLDTMIYENDYELSDSLQPINPGNSEVRRLAFASYPYSFYNQAGTELVVTASNIDKIFRVRQVERDDVEYFRNTIIDGYYPVVEAFTVDPVTKVAKYVIAYDHVVSTTLVSNRPMLVSDIYDTLDEDGEVVRKVELLNPAESKTVILPEDLQVDLGIGDIVQIEINGKNVLQAVTMMFDMSLGKDQTRVNTRGSNGGYHNLYFNWSTRYGTIVNFDGTIYTHTTSVKEDPDGIEAYNELHNYRHNGTIIYVYEDNNGKPEIKQGSIKDLVTYNMDPDTNQKAVVCIQRGGHIQYALLIKEG